MYLGRTDHWYLERTLWMIAGMVVLSGTLLGIFVNRYWFILPALAGFNMIIFSITGFCPMALLLHKLGLRPLYEGHKKGSGAVQK
ncbi:MAG: DUF2892 domain-containing protein [Thermodesulfatator sp.]|nr:MAG: DUF2892 domain-containing protein [Thermodesulfatator sp.]